MIVPTNCVSIPLKKMGPYLYHGMITDQRVLDRSHWIFSIRSPVGEVDLIGKTPELVKVCSQEFIEKLVSRALPGMTLTHMSAPPAAVAPRLEVQYFSIDKAGPCWNHLVKTREIGVYVPGDLPEPEIELLVVLEF
jgi:type VI secretion system protein ImpJ